MTMTRTLTTAITGALLLLATLSNEATAQAKKDFVGNAKCKLCHSKPAKGAQFTKWKEMDHAKALQTLSTEEAIAVGQRVGLATPPAESPECLKCHVTSYDVEKKAAHAKIKPADGIQCESCHGPASQHLLDGRAVMLKKGDGVDLSKGIILPTEKSCLECHNDTSPTWKADRYTLEDGKKSGFDFKQAHAKIAHPNPQNPKHQKKSE
jgi:hypothetical protein